MRYRSDPVGNPQVAANHGIQLARSSILTGFCGHRGSATTTCFAFVLVLVSAGPTGSASQCRDISKIDFANRTVVLSSVRSRPTLGEGPSAASAPPQIFHFQKGVSLENDGDTSPAGTHPAAPDWRTTITQDVTVRPKGSSAIRFLTLFRNHLTGTGSWVYLVGFACSGGHIRQVFQKSGVAMRVVQVSPTQLQLSAPVWKRSDPACCPSGRKKLIYDWIPSDHRYTLHASHE